MEGVEYSQILQEQIQVKATIDSEETEEDREHEIHDPPLSP